MKLTVILAVVAAGVVYGIADPHRLTPFVGSATLYVFLPLLLFEAAWNLNYRALRRCWRPIALLAGPGVAVTALIVAGALAVIHVPFATALLAGAILSATDPIAVVAVFRHARAPVALATIVESESLLNDAVAVVLYRGVLVSMAGALSVTAVASAALTGVAGSLAGVVLGILVAFAAARLLRGRSDRVLQTIATIVCAYGAYFAAESLSCSGIFATIACGIALRYFERSWVTLEIVESVDRAWDLGAMVANACVFFLVGAALDLREAMQHFWFVLVTLAGVSLARVVLTAALRPGGIPSAWLGVIQAAGLRGALSLALALALPAAQPYRSAIVAAAFVVALATIASSGFTVPRAVARAAGNVTRTH